MAYTYTQFKDYLASFLWRDGDTVLLNALDALIAMAEAELQRVLKVQDNQSIAALSFTGVPLLLPDDYRTLDQLVDGAGDYDYLTPGLFAERGLSGDREQRSFTIIGNDLVLAGTATVDTPHAVSLIYYRKLPSYQVTDASWLAETHLDLFTYAVLKHAGRFLRDDDRVAGWKEDYASALADVIDEDAKQRYSRGGPLKLVIRRQVR
jgi:hypothetical protein